MKTKLLLALTALATTLTLPAKQPTPAISGDYLEVRSCDIYTGACVANSEMGLSGKEGMLVWRVKHGAWKGASLDGLSVAAVVRTDATLGDVSLHPGGGRAVLIVDSRASRSQQEALADFARAQAGKLIKDVAAVKTAAMEVKMGQCASGACATVKAGDLLEISTRCLGDESERRAQRLHRTGRVPRARPERDVGADRPSQRLSRHLCPVGWAEP